MARAHRQGIPIRELPGRSSSSRVKSIPTSAYSSQRSNPDAERGCNGPGQACNDEEQGAPALTRRQNRLNMNKIAECREKSRSAWLHFPHVELVFLLFAFEGAVAAQVSAIRESTSKVVLCLAIISLVRFAPCSITLSSLFRVLATVHNTCAFVEEFRPPLTFENHSWQRKRSWPFIVSRVRRRPRKF